MLGFFRRYQRFIFIVITFVIVVSFSFFGTYNTGGLEMRHDPVMFKAVDGSPVSRSEVNEMALFLGTDYFDKLSFGGAWGPNFLNDGVIVKDILATGLGQQLAVQYNEDIKSELRSRLEREKYYTPYKHPQAKFINAEATWSYFAPGLKEQYDLLRSFSDGSEPNAIEARIALYINEKQFPSYALRQVLHYQESQYNWLTPDHNLQNVDLSLFGHHTLEDWFGRPFVELVSQFIINAAKIAEARGYEVTQGEALTELMTQSELVHQQLSQNPQIAGVSGSALMDEQLRRMGLDKAHAVKIWRQVMLFRRLFGDVGQSVFVDTLPYKQFMSHAKEKVVVDLYQLPKEFRFTDFRTLQKFEHYINKVAKENLDLLDIPQETMFANELMKKTPELVQRRYLIEISEANKQVLQAKVALKEAWGWEVSDAGWQALAAKFPDIGLEEGTDKENRFGILEKLDDNTRDRIDDFARIQIVDEHPEWLEDSLDAAQPTKKILAVRLKGGSLPLQGIEDRQQLISLLDNAPLNEQAQELKRYSGDDNNFYRIRVLERAPHLEVVTFAEANSDDTLDKLLDSDLENYYIRIREGFPQQFRQVDGQWKHFNEVKNAVAERYFDKLINSIHQDALALNSYHEKFPKKPSADFAATHRFYKALREYKSRFANHPEIALTESRLNDESSKGLDMQTRINAQDQWKLLRSEQVIERNQASEQMNLSAAFDMQPGEWSQANPSANGDISFFFVKGKADAEIQEKVALKTEEAHHLLGFEAEGVFMKAILKEITDKKAIILHKDQLEEESVE